MALAGLAVLTFGIPPTATARDHAGLPGCRTGSAAPGDRPRGRAWRPRAGARAAGRSVAGDGFAPDAQVSFAGTTPRVGRRAVSPAFLVATAAAGTRITVTTSAGSASGTVPPTNVRKPASQSSDYSSKEYPAGNAIDGNVGNFADTAEEGGGVCGGEVRETQP